MYVSPEKPRSIWSTTYKASLLGWLDYTRQNIKHNYKFVGCEWRNYNLWGAAATFTSLLMAEHFVFCIMVFESMVRPAFFGTFSFRFTFSEKSCACFFLGTGILSPTLCPLLCYWGLPHFLFLCYTAPGWTEIFPLDFFKTPWWKELGSFDDGIF